MSTQRQSTRCSQSIAIEHVRIETHNPFAEVKAALEALVPPLRTEFLTSLERGAVDDAARRLEDLADLSIFLVRDHGQLLRVAGQTRNALQYEIGNPLTASSMTRHHLAAALYAPLRIVLYETQHGTRVFEYDLPSSLFGQFRNDVVTEVGRKLDRDLEGALLKAAR